MNGQIDQGPIIFKTDINLDGHAKDIFKSLEMEQKIIRK